MLLSQLSKNGWAFPFCICLVFTPIPVSCYIFCGKFEASRDVLTWYWA